MNKAKQQTKAFEAKFNAMMGKTKESLTLSDAANHKYMDFVDPITGAPHLLFEWLFGCRGLPNGKLLQILGKQHCGKSSLLYYLYGMGLYNGAWIKHGETEQNALTPTRIKALGANSDLVMLQNPNGFEAFKTGLLELAPSVKATDAEGLYPLVYGLDSASNLGDSKVDYDTGARADTATPGAHARLFSAFFRDQTNSMKHNNLRLIVIGQFKSKIGTMPGESKQTTIAGNPIGFSAAWTLDLVKFKNKATPDECDDILIKCTKNKMSRNTGTSVRVSLYKDDRGWDVDTATARLLTTESYSPLKPGTFKTHGGRYYYEPFNDGKGLRAKDFMNEVYNNSKLLTDIRKAWDIVGYGGGDAKK
jgi:RecA/RadA recombinase